MGHTSSVKTRLLSAARMLMVLVILIAPGVSESVQQKGIQRKVIRTPSGQTVGGYGESHALLVGVSRYTHGWASLFSIPQELKTVAERLEAQGFAVETVLDPDARALRGAYTDFINRHGFMPDNRLLFFFSGHGHTREHKGKGYIVPTDAPDPRKDELGFLRKAVSMDDVMLWARRIEARHALFLFDSCFSGTVFEAKGGLPDVPPHISAYTSKPVRQFITAGSEGEEVPARSIFTPAFVRALEGEGDLDGDGYITGTELGMHLHDRVIYYSKQQQTPQYGKIRDIDLDRGDFVFILEEADVRSFLSVRSNVAGARVRLNGRDIGMTPVDKVPVEPGEHRLWVEKEGFEIEQRPVQVSPGRHARLYVALKEKEPDRSRLYVYTDPEDARVRILNIRPVFEQGMDLPPGRYEVEASADGCETRTQWVSLGPGRDEYLDMALQCGGGPGDRFTNSLGMAFVYIPRGEFMMGSPSNEPGRDDDETQHRVTLTKGFYMGTTEVTQGQWKAVTGSNPSRFKDCGDDCPVEKVSWNDVQAFIQKLNRREGETYRLPTEAEWEYAARAGTTTPFTYGRCLSTNQANYNGDYPLEGCGKGEDRSRTIPVGSLNAPNAWGLHDMHGNVWEWCADWYGDYPSGSVIDPAGPLAGSDRVLRGGSWSSIAGYCRSAYRGYGTPSRRGNNGGFRLALSPGQ